MHLLPRSWSANFGNNGTNVEIAWADIAGNPTPNVTVNPNTLDEVRARHLDTAVMLYADGHVKSLRVTALNQRNNNNVLSMFSRQDD
jgi:prepilin-type processing-associated H-X9-DG protein